MLGQAFVIKREQQTLKFLLEQQVGTTAQQKWIAKLMVYDFLIEYKAGKENKVANALSRRHKAEDNSEKLEVMLALIIFLTPSWINELKESYALPRIYSKFCLSFRLKKRILRELLYNKELY